MKISDLILRQIIEKSETSGDPFYLYDNSAIEKKCSEFKNITYTNKSIHFASMANANLEFLSLVKQQGLGIFVNSIPHLSLANSLGFNSEDIVFTSSAMQLSSMKQVSEAGAIINLDSIGQIKIWEKHFPNKKYGIRCNIGTEIMSKNTRAGQFIGPNSRLGLIKEEIFSLKGNPMINGLHIYIGTDLFDLKYFKECYSVLAEMTNLFPNLEYLDFGGGFGSDKNGDASFDFYQYSIMVSELMTYYSENYGKELKLILEPGRIIGGQAGFFICRVTDIKHRNGVQIIGVNASSVQFPRPLFYNDSAWHPVIVFDKYGNEEINAKIESAIVGASTYSNDYLARTIKLPSVDIDDIIVFGNAGSYCSSSHTSFLGFPPAKEYFL